MPARQDLDKVLKSLETAANKASFLRAASEFRGIDSLSPGEFLTELLDDVEAAADAIRQVRNAYLCNLLQSDSSQPVPPSTCKPPQDIRTERRQKTAPRE